MITAENIQDVRDAVGQARRSGKTIGFVPTMGGLHEGHFSLIDAARAECDFVVVSIFVNPTQFAPGEDLGNYPRTPEADLTGCREHGADLVFLPSEEVMYGVGSLTEIRVSQLSQPLCGRNRPTHFAGVCTVVAKLFNIVQPDIAYFGQKDYQQVTIIRRMVSDLNIPVEICTCPIVRENDGLAMSTRNKYLSPEQRSQAVALHGSLSMASDLIRSQHPSVKRVIEEIVSFLKQNAPDGQVDYVQIVDPSTLQDVEDTDSPVVIALAVKFATARLIDNMLVDSGTQCS